MSECLFVAGLLHFFVLIASALVPQVLDWRRDLAQLHPLTRKMIWVHGIYIVFVIVGFGVVATWHADALAGGTPLARTVCAAIALFWGSRLLLQYGVLGASSLLEKWWLRLGYHGLTVTFGYFTFVFGWAAL